MIQYLTIRYACAVSACMSAPVYVFACVFQSAAVGRVCVILSGAKDCCSGNTVLLL